MLNRNQIIVFDSGNIYYGGDAIKCLLQVLYPNSLINKLILWIPIFFVNIVYRVIANSRYLFGSKKLCNVNFSIRGKLLTDANN